MAEDSLTITDNRTGKTYEVPIFHGTYPKYASAINTADLRGIKVDDDDFGLMGYDPSYLNTASCKSSITFIDGDKGILRYRGIPIEQLAEKSTFVETSWLLIYGELPNAEQLNQFRSPAQRRLIFEEFFAIQVGLAVKRKENDTRQKPLTIRVDDRIRRSVGCENF